MFARILLFLTLSALTFAQRRPAQPRTLDIYWIDVEGGAATLIVARPVNRSWSIRASPAMATATRSASCRPQSPRA